MPEQQNIEYKQSWRDEYIKWICGFANAQGGKIFIGIDDKEEVTGLDDYKKLMDDIPNKIVNHLGLVVDVNLRKKGEKYYIEIDVPVSTVPISYHGAYHYRSGSTKQELKGNALNQFILKKMGISWEQQPVPEASLKDIDEETVKNFVQKAVSMQRISESAVNADTLTILKNLKLINEQGEFLLAALLLFGKEPDKYALGCYFKIGRFVNSDSDLRFQDIVEGNILNMADKVMRKLNDRYLIRPISYKGLERMEPLEYPEQALREAILNSIIHKNYSRTNIFLSVYNDRLIIWNPGGLPASLSIEMLKKKHGSEPRNGLIARVFFMAGYIESWGRGIDIMMEGCRQYGIPEPVIVEEQDGISVTFLKDIYTEEYLRTLDINERQVKAILYIKEHRKITNTKYQEINTVGKTLATEELRYLIDKELIIQSGSKGRGSRYELKR
ncbi:MAG: putative DNA binding domain-containing protein [Prolixibacteraceae bacterium]|nr:putative DNA binding domain-containing protein [Prolixibacteraceae bacterium]